MCACYDGNVSINSLIKPNGKADSPKNKQIKLVKLLPYMPLHSIKSGVASEGTLLGQEEGLRMVDVVSKA